MVEACQDLGRRAGHYVGDDPGVAVDRASRQLVRTRIVDDRVRWIGSAFIVTSPAFVVIDVGTPDNEHVAGGKHDGIRHQTTE